MARLSFLLSVYLTAASLLGSIEALDYSQWQAPGPDDSRSPCPALNALANHGFLPRDGRGITLKKLEEVLPETLNVGTDLAKLFYYGATFMGLTKNGQFDLTNLTVHNAIEHDGSVSRADAATGDNHSFNQDIFDSYIAQFGDAKIMTTETAGKARMFHIQAAKKANPNFTYGIRQQIISNGETSLILAIFGDIDEGNANIEHVKIFYEQERLPYTEGWRRSEKPITVLNVAKMTNKVLSDSGQGKIDILTIAQATGNSWMRRLKAPFAYLGAKSEL